MTFKPESRYLAEAGRWLCIATIYLSVGTAFAQSSFQHVKNGFALLEKSKPTKAIEAFEQALEAPPKPKTASEKSELLSYTALACFKAGRYVDCLEHFDRAVQLDEQMVDSTYLFYRAQALRALGLRRLERNTWHYLKKWDPQSRFVKLADEALAQKATESTDEIALLIDEGLRLLDDLPAAASAFFYEATLRQPSNTTMDSAVYLAVALNKAGNFNSAATITQTYKPPKDLEDLWHLQTGLTYMGLNKWVDATTAFKRVAKSSPHYGDATYAQVLCHHNLGEREFATSLLKNIPQHGDLKNTADAFKRIVNKSEPKPRLNL